MEALRRGWYLGKESFRDNLLGLMDKAKPANRKRKDSHAGGAVSAHNESEAERIVVAVGGKLGLYTKRKELRMLRKGDRRKVIVPPSPKAAQRSAMIGWPN